MAQRSRLASAGTQGLLLYFVHDYDGPATTFVQHAYQFATANRFQSQSDRQFNGIHIAGV